LGRYDSIDGAVDEIVGRMSQQAFYKEADSRAAVIS
jgi:hypothetical protein